MKCKNCKHLCLEAFAKINGEHEHIGYWCEKIIDDLDREVERDCEYYEPMTNADRIRRMTDEELSKFMDEFSDNGCSYCLYDKKCYPLVNFKSGFLEWLQSKSVEE